MKRPIYYVIAAAIIGGVAIVFYIVLRLGAWPPNEISGLQSKNYSATPMTHLSIFYSLKDEDGAIRQSNHLYLLTICPDVSLDRSQFAESHLNERPYYYRYARMRWKTQIGMVELKIRWNPWSDTIDVGKQTFDRKSGNVYVAARQSNGEWDSRQCGTLGAYADYDRAAQYILKIYNGDLPMLERSE